MRKSGWRLAVSAIMLAVWMGYLAYLAATTTHPIVLSRPQFLTADLYIVAQLAADPASPDAPAEGAKVKKALWTAHRVDASLADVEVKGLNKVSEAQGWHGPGEYILALSRVKGSPGQFHVTPLPRTPGFPGGPGRIYSATPATLRQLEMLTKEYHSDD